MKAERCVAYAIYDIGMNIDVLKFSEPLSSESQFPRVCTSDDNSAALRVADPEPPNFLPEFAKAADPKAPKEPWCGALFLVFLCLRLGGASRRCGAGRTGTLMTGLHGSVAAKKYCESENFFLSCVLNVI
ncbi:hypothetical protein HGRIS_012151 [Hohenbuehelia grisea]|uniref:Uncharacterized protein n=1 Tax=Hohenbuehelia grisea TaxID=104357 RepID=A0ABR3IRG4_9AGAR